MTSKMSSVFLFSSILLVSACGGQTSFVGKSKGNAESDVPSQDDAPAETQNSSSPSEGGASPSTQQKSQNSVGAVDNSKVNAPEDSVVSPTATGTATPKEEIKVAKVGPRALLRNAPSGISSATLLGVEVYGADGEDLVKYRYTIVSGASFCDSKTFGAAKPIGDLIKDNLSQLQDGPVTLCVLGVDSEGNEQNSSSPTRANWIKDTTPGTARLSGAPQGLTNVRTAKVTVSGDGVAKYKWGMHRNCEAATYSQTPVDVSVPIDVNVTGDDGQQKLCVKGVTAAGNVQSKATEASWTLDTTPPVAVIKNVPTGNSSLESVTAKIEDAEEFKFAFVNGQNCPTLSSYSSFQKGSISLDVSKMPQGSVKLCVLGRDLAGNVQQTPTEAEWVYDMGALNITGAPSGESKLLKFNVKVTGVSPKFKYAVIEGTDCANALYFPTERSLQETIAIDVTLKNDGPLSICAVAVNSNGIEQPADKASRASWIKDTRPPSDLTLIGVPSGTSNILDLVVQVKSTGAKTYQYQITDGAKDCDLLFAKDPSPIEKLIQEDLSVYADGSMKICAWSQDAAGNRRGPESQTWVKKLAACGTIASGGTATRVAFRADSVPFGQSCEEQNQTGRCENGYMQWNGSFAFESCSVATAEDCSAGGVVVKHGKSHAFFDVAIHSNCSTHELERTCTNGNLSGDEKFKYATCAQQTCDGLPIDYKDTRSRFQITNPLGSCDAVKENQEKTCKADGTWTAWTGSFSETSCASGCGNMRHGDSVSRVRYAMPTNSSNLNCTQETQYQHCTNGNMGPFSGSATGVSGCCQAGQTTCLAGSVSLYGCRADGMGLEVVVAQSQHCGYVPPPPPPPPPVNNSTCSAGQYQCSGQNLLVCEGPDSNNLHLKNYGFQTNFRGISYPCGGAPYNPPPPPPPVQTPVPVPTAVTPPPKASCTGYSYNSGCYVKSYLGGSCSGRCPSGWTYDANDSLASNSQACRSAISAMGFSIGGGPNYAAANSLGCHIVNPTGGYQTGSNNNNIVGYGPASLYGSQANTVRLCRCK